MSPDIDLAYFEAKVGEKINFINSLEEFARRTTDPVEFVKSVSENFEDLIDALTYCNNKLRRKAEQTKSVTRPSAAGETKSEGAQLVTIGNARDNNASPSKTNPVIKYVPLASAAVVSCPPIKTKLEDTQLVTIDHARDDNASVKTKPETTSVTPASSAQSSSIFFSAAESCFPVNKKPDDTLVPPPVVRTASSVIQKSQDTPFPSIGSFALDSNASSHSPVSSTGAVATSSSSFSDVTIGNRVLALRDAENRRSIVFMNLAEPSGYESEPSSDLCIVLQILKSIGVAAVVQHTSRFSPKSLPADRSSFLKVCFSSEEEKNRVLALIKSNIGRIRSMDAKFAEIAVSDPAKSGKVINKSGDSAIPSGVFKPKSKSASPSRSTRNFGPTNTTASFGSLASAACSQAPSKFGSSRFFSDDHTVPEAASSPPHASSSAPGPSPPRPQMSIAYFPSSAKKQAGSSSTDEQSFGTKQASQPKKPFSARIKSSINNNCVPKSVFGSSSPFDQPLLANPPQIRYTRGAPTGIYTSDEEMITVCFLLFGTFLQKSFASIDTSAIKELESSAGNYEKKIYKLEADLASKTNVEAELRSTIEKDAVEIQRLSGQKFGLVKTVKALNDQFVKSKKNEAELKTMKESLKQILQEPHKTHAI